MAIPWFTEDGGARRLQSRPGVFADFDPRTAVVTSRDAHGATMVVVDAEGSVFLHGHAVSDDTTCWVERIDPVTLETLHRVDSLPGGPRWPGGIGVLPDGSLLVVFGNHAHRLSPSLEVLTSVALPHERPYNSFVVLSDGHVVTKDFGGALPGELEDPALPGAQLLVLDPVTLAVVASADLPERSIARLSADGDTVYVVGDTSLFRLIWTGTDLVVDSAFAPVYRSLEGQSFGWDAVIALGAAWVLDDGAGSQNYAGTFRGVGTNSSPLHVVRVDTDTAEVGLTEVCGLPNGLIANPPLVDPDRRMVVGYDSSNGVIAGFAIDPDGSLEKRWSHEQDHASHLLLDSDSGVFMSADHDGERWVEQLVLRDIETGAELARVDSGSPLQSPVFPAAGPHRCVYQCTFSTLSALRW